MAVENLKGTLNITKLDTEPSGFVTAQTNGGNEKLIIETLEKADTGDGSTYIVARVPSHAIVTEFSIIHDSLTGMTDVDAGVYTAADADNSIGTEVDKDCLADGISLASAGTKDGITSVDAANVGKKLYELAGVSEDPEVLYDIVLTANTAGSGTGTISSKLKYITN